VLFDCHPNYEHSSSFNSWSSIFFLFLIFFLHSVSHQPVIHFQVYKYVVLMVGENALSVSC